MAQVTFRRACVSCAYPLTSEFTSLLQQLPSIRKPLINPLGSVKSHFYRYRLKSLLSNFISSWFYERFMRVAPAILILGLLAAIMMERRPLFASHQKSLLVNDDSDLPAINKTIDGIEFSTNCIDTFLTSIKEQKKPSG